MTAVRYVDDALEVDLEPIFPRLRVRSWDAGMTAEVLRAGAWRTPHSTRGILFLRERESPERDPVVRFLDAIPEHALALATGCGGHQLAALRLLRRFPAARDLATTPNLLWLVARRADARPMRDETIARVLARPRHEVLSWCLRREVPKSAVRLLARCVIDRTERTVSLLRRTLPDAEARRALAHAEAITVDHLRFVDRHRELLGYRFSVGALARRGADLAQLPTLHREALRFGANLGVANARSIVASADYDDLVHLHARWRDRAEERMAFERAVRSHGGAFPEPPLPGTDTIVPIRTPDDLLAESLEMRHCVLAFVQDVFEGRRYVYRVLAPMRATVMVSVPEGELVELAGAENQAVTKACVAAVEHWIRDARA